MKLPSTLLLGFFLSTTIAPAFAASGESLTSIAPQTFCENYAEIKNYDAVAESLFTSLSTSTNNKKFFTTCWDEYTRSYDRQLLPGFYGVLANNTEYLSQIAKNSLLTHTEKALFFQHLLLSQRNTVDLDHAIPLYLEMIFALDDNEDPELLAQISPLETLSPLYSALSQETKMLIEKSLPIEGTGTTQTQSYVLEIRGLQAIDSGEYKSFLSRLDLRKKYSDPIKSLFTISLLGDGRWAQAKLRILASLKVSHTLQQGLRFPTSIDSNFGFQENMFTSYSKEQQEDGVIALFTALGHVKASSTLKEETISRASTLKVLFDVFVGKEIVDSFYAKNMNIVDTYHLEQYNETLALDAWYTPYAVYGLEHNLLKKGQALHLGDHVSKAEVLTILTRLTNLRAPTEKTMSGSTLLPETKNTWFEEYVPLINSLPKNSDIPTEIRGKSFEKALKSEVLRWSYIFLPEMK